MPHSMSVLQRSDKNNVGCGMGCYVRSQLPVPIMLLFFLAVGLPKLQFLGTGAWFFFFLNLFKVPFYWSIDLITMDTLILDLKLAPVVILGVIIGRHFVLKIPQKGFELFALTVTILASLRLIF